MESLARSAKSHWTSLLFPQRCPTFLAGFSSQPMRIQSSYSDPCSNSPHPSSSPHPFNLSSKLDLKNSSLKNLCLLIGLFNAFIFNIITDILVFITDILLCVFYMSYLLFVLLLCKYAFCVKSIFYSIPIVGINNIRTIVSKVMSLLFSMLSRFIIAFLPRGKRLLISRLQSPSTVTLEPKKIKYVTASTFSVFCFTILLFLFAMK